MLKVYLAGEIHTNWREEIIDLCAKEKLDIKFNKDKEEELEIDIDLQNDYLLNEGMLILSDYLYLNTNLLLSEAA